MRKRVCMYVCMYARMYVCTYVRTVVCMYVRTYVCTYVCTYASIWVPSGKACMMYDAHHSPASARSEATSENAVRKALFEAVRCHLTASAAPSAAPPAAWAGCGWARGNGAMMQCYDAMVTWPLTWPLEQPGASTEHVCPDHLFHKPGEYVKSKGSKSEGRKSEGRKSKGSAAAIPQE